MNRSFYNQRRSIAFSCGFVSVSHSCSSSYCRESMSTWHVRNNHVSQWTTLRTSTSSMVGQVQECYYPSYKTVRSSKIRKYMCIIKKRNEIPNLQLLGKAGLLKLWSDCWHVSLTLSTYNTVQAILEKRTRTSRWRCGSFQYFFNVFSFKEPTEVLI